KGDALLVRLEGGKGSSRVTAKIGVKAEHGVEKVGETAEIPVVRPGEWLGIRVSYDRNQLSISTDNGFGWMPRGSKPETRRLAIAPDAPLVVGGFVGLLDDFRFAGV